MLTLAVAPASAAPAAGELQHYEMLPSLSGAVEWLNSPPLTPATLRGKVVLVDFWTYTCVNWRRTLPYVRAWAHKYKDKGLVVIGVHTPEFSFEADVANVRQALREMHIDYPVAVDSEDGIWNAFNNEYWPALYLADAQGHIRYHQFGEGAYAVTETMIRQLLGEAGSHGLGSALVSVHPRGLEVAADSADLVSPETYTGYDRTAGFASTGGARLDVPRVYSVPARLLLNSWAPAGNWTIGAESARLNSGAGRIAYCFHARDLNLVMGPAARNASVRFRVLIDGRPPGAAHGSDDNPNGYGTLLEQRAYQLVRQPKPIRDRRFEIYFFSPGVEAFDFTFG